MVLKMMMEYRIHGDIVVFIGAVKIRTHMQTVNADTKKTRAPRRIVLRISGIVMLMPPFPKWGRDKRLDFIFVVGQ
jgi:hypothetical protein